jgi:hypothetical protein
MFRALSGRGGGAAAGDEATMAREAEAGWSAGAGTRLEGKDAVGLSRALRDMKESGGSGEGVVSREAAVVRKIGDRTFVRIHGVFVDTAYKADMKALKVKFGSDLYFALARTMPELKKCFALGENVIVIARGKALIVGEEGEERMSDDEIKAFMQ